MTIYKDMYRVTAGGVSNTPEDVEVDVDVVFWNQSVEKEARWGQTIGTEGVYSCHGIFVVGKQGAYLSHTKRGIELTGYTADEINVPRHFLGPDCHQIYFEGTTYTDTDEIFKGRSKYAFTLSIDKARDDQTIVDVFVSESSFIRTDPAPPPQEKTDYNSEDEYTNPWSKIAELQKLT